MCVSASWDLMSHILCALCAWVRSMHPQSLKGLFACIVSTFLWESFALVCPFSWGNQNSHLHLVVPLQPRWVGDCNRGVRRWSLPTSLRKVWIFIIHHRRARASCWMMMCCLSCHPSGSECAPHLKPRWAERGCWDWPCLWALTDHLPCIWWVVGRYVSRHGKIRSALEARVPRGHLDERPLSGHNCPILLTFIIHRQTILMGCRNMFFCQCFDWRDAG